MKIRLSSKIKPVQYSKAWEREGIEIVLVRDLQIHSRTENKGQGTGGVELQEPFFHLP